MSEVIIVALISLAGTLGGSFLGVITSNKLVNYRLQQLEEKVNQHNNLIDRMYKCEEEINLIQMEEKQIEEKIKLYHNN